MILWCIVSPQRTISLFETGVDWVEATLTLCKIGKMWFAQKEIMFLGHRLAHGKVKMDERKV